MEMHHDGKPQVDQSKCIGCHACERICAHGAPVIENKIARIDWDKCVGCGRCIGACPMDAVNPPEASASMEMLNKRMAEYAWAILAGRPHFHISLIVDVSPYCDCHAENDAPVVPDIGMLASFDPVALDQACADLGKRRAGNAKLHFWQSILPPTRKKQPSMTISITLLRNSEWKACLEHAEKIGMGTRSYELITVK